MYVNIFETINDEVNKETAFSLLCITPALYINYYYLFFIFFIKFKLIKHFCIGDSVWAAGYPTFRAQFDNDLVVTRGVVSRVTRPAHALATTCCIQSGQSGGPLLRPDDLAILGMVVSNAKDAHSGAVHPRINLAVPATALRQPIQQYLRTQGMAHRCQ